MKCKACAGAYHLVSGYKECAGRVAIAIDGGQMLGQSGVFEPRLFVFIIIIVVVIIILIFVLVLVFFVIIFGLVDLGLLLRLLPRYICRRGLLWDVGCLALLRRTRWFGRRAGDVALGFGAGVLNDGLRLGLDWGWLW